ncbi:hypothetical protein B5F33_03650 [Collinsella sp. An2]|nr:hypothetical protein B5F33_03650 [Collinsella sp. An2]
MIDALPTAEALASMSLDEQATVYDQVQAACDAYTVLTDEQKEQITGAEVINDLFAVFNGTVNALADNTYNINSGNVVISESGSYTITGSGNTTNTITVNSGVMVTITLNNVNIDLSNGSGPAFDIQSGANVTLILEGANTLTSGDCIGINSSGAPGIHLPTGASLTIQSLNGDASASLAVKGGKETIRGGAGIGGDLDESCGTVTINSGCVEINGGDAVYAGGVGIGGGTKTTYTAGNGGTVIINGGTVNITGGAGRYGGAGIGGGVSASGPAGSGGVTVITGGNVTVTGGAGDYVGGAGIGGGTAYSGQGVGGNGGTVVVLNGAEITGGLGDDRNGNDCGVGISTAWNDGADSGDGILPSGDDYSVYGDLELPDDIVIHSGVTVTIPDGTSLIIPENIELVVDGTLKVEEGGSLSNGGTISGSGTLTGDGTVANNGGTITVSNNDFAANVTLSITSGGSPVGSVTYGSTVTLTANVTDGSGAVNSGTVYFYQGSNTSGTLLNSGGTNVNSGKASYSLTLNDASWTPSEKAYTITAVYAPGQDSGLLSGNGAGALTVSKATPGEPPDGPNILNEKTTTSVTLNPVDDDGADIYGTIQYGYITGDETSVPEDRWQNSNAFTSLSPGTDYTFYTRYAGNDYYNPSNLFYFGYRLTTLPSVTTTSLTSGYVGVEYEAQLEASVADNKTVTWTLANGATLPEGLTLNASTGVISGVPKATATSHSFTVQASIDSIVNFERITNTAILSISINAGKSDISANTYNGETQTDTFNYGDTITVKGTISPSSQTPSDGINAIAEPAQNQVGLYLGETELATADVENGGGFTLTYDTSNKGIPIGEEQTLTVKYGGSSDLIAGSATVTITLNRKPVTVAFTGPATKTYDGNVKPPEGLAVVLADGVVVGDDDVTVSAAGIAYDSPGVGTDKTITASGLVLGGDNADWYDLRETSATTAGSIRSPYVPPSTPSGPVSGGTKGWDSIIDKLKGAKDGDTVTVDMKGTTELPAEALEAVAGRDVTLVLDMGEGVSWEIRGVDVPADMAFTDLDMGVEMGTDAISADVVNLVTGEAGSVELTLAHDGPFGFTLTLVAPLGEEAKGLVANLYHYDPEKGLAFETSGEVGEDGSARLPLNHASTWLVALDRASHALPFADTSEGEWYSEAIRWAWLHGVMTGYDDGSNLFGTGDALTRAQLAATLYKAAGSPAADPAGVERYSDCDPGAWYAEAVSWASDQGLMSGYDDGSGRFAPDAPLTREQLATVFWRAAGSPEAEADLGAFPDGGETSPWARPAVSWAVSTGLLKGYDNTGELGPAGTLTRAQMATVLYRLAAEGAGGDLGIL